MAQVRARTRRTPAMNITGLNSLLPKKQIKKPITTKKAKTAHLYCSIHYQRALIDVTLQPAIE
jgi:hypothetical protein